MPGVRSSNSAFAAAFDAPTPLICDWRGAGPKRATVGLATSANSGSLSVDAWPGASAGAAAGAAAPAAGAAEPAAGAAEPAAGAAEPAAGAAEPAAGAAEPAAGAAEPVAFASAGFAAEPPPAP